MKNLLTKVATIGALTISFATAAFAPSTPTEMVGKWKWGTINPTWFEDKYTGEYKGHGGGVSAYFEFEKNGKFKHFVYVEMNTNGFKNQTYTTMEGTVAAEGDTFRLKVEKGFYRSRSNMGAKNNFDRPMTDEERSKASKNPYKWRKAADEQGKEVLQIINGAQGPWTSFRRDK